MLVRVRRERVPSELSETRPVKVGCERVPLQLGGNVSRQSRVGSRKHTQIEAMKLEISSKNHRTSKPDPPKIDAEKLLSDL